MFPSAERLTTHPSHATVSAPDTMENAVSHQSTEPTRQRLELVPKQALFPAAALAMRSPATSVRSLRSPELDDARIALVQRTPLASASPSPRSKTALDLGLAPKQDLFPAAGPCPGA